MKAASTLVLSLLAVIPYVAAHGFVYQVTIDGKLYTGNIPNAQTAPSIIRQIDDVSPVKGASNPYLNCGQDAQFASQVGSANPGSAVTFSWKGGDLSNWPHNIGPMLTYMTSCGSTPCSQYNSSSSQWFKIDEVGKTPGDNSTWLQQQLMNGAVANVTIPSNIAPGNYLIRHEIIALHLANEMGGAEFYPSCTQLTIGGSGTGTPNSNELVTLPGAYSDSDPGIYDPNVFDPNAPYVFPGPPVAAFVGSSEGGSSSSGSGSSNSGNSTGTPTPSTPSSSTSGGKGSCRLKPTATSFSGNLRRAMRPHTLSRIMRHLSH